MFSKVSRSISRVSVADLPSFTQNLDANRLLDFAMHRRQKETRNRRSTHVKTKRVHSAMSRGTLKQ
jgi:hypothetical protein